MVGILSANAVADNIPDYGAAMDRIFAQWSDSTPGCAVGVSRAGLLVFSKAYGSADLEHHIPNTLDTVFEAGSVSKQFTAMALLMLASEGRLSLDDPARKYVPEMPDYPGPVTIREMLTHTSGLRDWGEIALFEGWPRTTRVYDDADILKMISRQSELNFPPGTHWSYSNTGYNLAEIIVSRVSGMSLAEYTRQRIFLPLGMTHTSWRDDFTRVVSNRAVAYARTADGFRADMPFENAYGHAGLLTTVGDLLKWNEHLSSPGAADAPLVEAQQHMAVLNNGRPTAYGDGVFIHRFKGAPEIAHTGSTAGYRAFLARYPSVGLSVAMLCNIADVDTWDYGHAIANVWFTDPAKPQATATNTFPLSAAQVSHLVGTYRNVLTGRPTNVSAESGKLSLAGHTLLRPISPTRFRLDDKMAEFDAHGALTISDGYGIVDRFQRTAPANPPTLQPPMLAGRYASPDIAGEVTVLATGASVTLKFGTKTTLVLAPAYEATFSNELVTAMFSGDDNGRPTQLTLSSDSVWRLRLDRVP